MNTYDKEAGLPVNYPDGPVYSTDSPASESETAVPDVALKPIGVLKVEAAEAAWNSKTKWILFISYVQAMSTPQTGKHSADHLSLGLAAYVCK